MKADNWTQIKNFIDERKSSIQWVEFNNYYRLKAIDGPHFIEYELDKNPTDTTDLEDFENNYKLKGNESLNKLTKERDRLFVATNRIPGGFTQYLTGQSDDPSNDSYGTGDKLRISAGQTKTLQMKDHYYVIGARATFNNDTTIDDEANANLRAPASTGWSDNVSNTGNANKVEITPSSGLYILIPAPLNDGNINLDLTAFKTGSTTVLANTPVPKSGNNGYFNYNSDANELTTVENPASPNGGYNLYTFDISLHKFGNSIFGCPNASLNFEAADIVGKLLYNCWVIDFTFEKDPDGNDSNSQNRNPRCAITLNLGVKKNVN